MALESIPTYFIKKGETVSGPLEIENLRTLRERGHISEKIPVSTSASGPWRSLENLERELQALTTPHQLRLRETSAPFAVANAVGKQGAPINLRDIIAVANRGGPKGAPAPPQRARNDVEIMVAKVAETITAHEAPLDLEDRRKGRKRTYLSFLVIFNTLLGIPLVAVLRSGVMSSPANAILLVILFGILIFGNIWVYWTLYQVGSKY